MKIFSKIILKLLNIAKWFAIISVAITLFYRFVPVAYTPLMFWKTIGSVFTEKKIIGMEKKWVPLEDIAKPMRNAVIKAEDYKFFQHHGFDFEAIEKAMQYNKTHKKKKGASTISQQTAKNVFLWPSRSWVRKGLEAYFTVLIELMWSKDRIMEVYLNVIELGKGVYGVEAASQKFFKKPAKKLNNREAALMAAVLPNPIKFRVDKPSRYVSNRQRKIMGTKLPKAPVIAKVEEKPMSETVQEKAQEFFDLKFDDEDKPENRETETKTESKAEEKIEDSEPAND
jgi:monofunctional biosynthetic peptidoglycan transglycosylase